MKFQLDGIKIIITRTKKTIFRTAIITITMIVLMIISLSALDLANKNKLAHGLRIANISVGGLSANEAQTKIEKSVDEFLKKDIILRYEHGKNNSEISTALPEALGIQINVAATLNAASRIGHQGQPFSSVIQQILAFFGYYNLPLNYGVNEIQLEKFIREKLNNIDKPAVNAGFVYAKDRKDFISVPPQEGIIINRADLKLQLYEKIEKLTKNDIFLNLINDHPEVFEDETKEAYAKAKTILGRTPYKLTINDPLKIAPAQVSLTKEELISLIEFGPIKDKNNPENKVLGVNLNRIALNDYLTKIGSSINRSPINAQLTIQNSRVTNFSLSEDGLKLEVEKNISKIREEIIDKGAREIELEISVIPPKIATKDINNLGITSLLAKGVSNFSGSPKNRIYNIGIGAAKFNGVLLKPGEEFSFNTILGEVGPETGYKAELVIKQNKTVPEYGGGLCQVSTTAFRAAVYAGLPIKERQAHAFPVKYYNPQGFDATIYPPHPDLRFVNDTPSHLLIQTKIKGNELTFEFYGTDDGRTVEIEGPYQYNIKEDGSMKAQLIRRIFDKDGNFIGESIFNSNYKSPSLYPIEKNPLE
jgi:vancomycin resistance protein YoaR